MLSDYPELRSLGSSKDRDNSMITVLKDKPDLVFMNIDNVLSKPFEFAREIDQLSTKSPVIVPLSKSKDGAYDAMKHGFFDYLLKPLEELDIRKCILKHQKTSPVDTNKTICLKSYKDFQYLDTDKILFLKADNNTTDFYMKDGGVVGAFKTLRTFEDILPQNFLRIHKSYIINRNHVSRIQYGKSVCTLRDASTHIPFTKTFIDNVEVINNALYQSSFLTLN